MTSDDQPIAPIIAALNVAGAPGTSPAAGQLLARLMG